MTTVSVKTSSTKVVMKNITVELDGKDFQIKFYAKGSSYTYRNTAGVDREAIRSAAFAMQRAICDELKSDQPNEDGWYEIEQAP